MPTSIFEAIKLKYRPQLRKNTSPHNNAWIEVSQPQPSSSQAAARHEISPMKIDEQVELAPEMGKELAVKRSVKELLLVDQRL